jgi:hypothetical protein
MQKLVDGKLVDMSAGAVEVRLMEEAEGAHEALQAVKTTVIERIDAKLWEFQRQAWMAGTKASIMSSTSIEAVRAIYEGIQWEVPTTAVALPKEPLIIPKAYDDKWIRDQMSNLAQALRHLDHHGTKFVNETLTQIAEAKDKIEELERRLTDVETAQPIIINQFDEETPTFPEEDYPEEPAKHDWKTALHRVAAAEAAEAGADINDLPPIEVEPLPEPEIVPEPVSEPGAALPAPVQPEPTQVIISDQAERRQIRYEVAMRAVNGNVEALKMLGLEAAKLGLEVKTLAHKIVNERIDLERKVMMEFAQNA